MTALPPEARDEGDDRRLLAAHLAGDGDAFGLLVRRHRDRLWAVALRTMGDREDAADALQDALVSAYRNAAGYRGDAAVTTWLHRIVVNACIDRMRRRQARPSVPLEDREVPARRDDHAATEARLDVHAALARLPAAQRAALVLVDLEDLPVAEAAELLGVAEGTVKSRCARGRMALAAILRGDDAGNPGAPGSVRPERDVSEAGERPLPGLRSRDVVEGRQGLERRLGDEGRQRVSEPPERTDVTEGR